MKRPLDRHYLLLLNPFYHNGGIFLGVSLIFPWFFSFFKVKLSSVSLCVMYTFIPLDNYYHNDTISEIFMV